ncbi:hypothetical protein CPT_Machias_229 [Staphylococcus phage Machias]|nr:hypothetical protein CPT_Machias_229 [Staphylococcus phage Machias]
MHKEPRQAKVLYVKVVTDDRNEIIDLQCNNKDVYLNSVNSLSLSFNDLEFDTSKLRFYETEMETQVSNHPMDYNDFKETALDDKGFYAPEVDTTLVITDSNYDNVLEINVFNI